MDQVKFVEDCLCRPYSFKLFEGCLPQILLNRFLNTLSHIWKEENLHDASDKFDVYMSTLVYFAHTAVNVVHINYMETFLLPFSFEIILEGSYWVPMLSLKPYTNLQEMDTFFIA